MLYIFIAIISLLAGYLFRVGLEPPHECKFTRPVKIHHSGSWHYFMMCNKCRTLDPLDECELEMLDLSTFTLIEL